MKAFIGLGNPGKKYQNSRHNLGNNVILSLFQDLKLNPRNHPKLSASIVKYQNNLLIISHTYMNDSGRSVQKILNYFKITPANLYIIHDDLDLGVGDYKIQFDRGPAGHNGIKSIIDHLNTQAFHRLRIGIDHPQDNTPPESYVLRPFTPTQKPIINQTIDKIIPEIKNLMVGSPTTSPSTVIRAHSSVGKTRQSH